MNKQNRIIMSFAIIVAVNSVPAWLEKHWGISTFVSVLAIGVPSAVWAFLAHQQTGRAFAAERAAIEAKYEAKMAQLIEDAAVKHQPTP